jgi:hypothetical protein
MDLGDKTSRDWLLEGDAKRENSRPTTKKAVLRMFGSIPRWRIAIEVGAHSRWVSRLLKELGRRAWGRQHARGFL